MSSSSEGYHYTFVEIEGKKIEVQLFFNLTLFHFFFHFPPQTFSQTKS